jgi:hypothetical protein
MRSLTLLILTTIILFPSCKTMHGGSGGMDESHENDHSHDPNTDGIHVMDDRFHVEIHINPTEPLLIVFTITETETGNPAQHISGFLTVGDTVKPSDLKTGRPHQGEYITVVYLPDDKNDEFPGFLTIKDKQGVQSTFDFTIDLEQAVTDQQDPTRRSFLTTKMLIGIAVGVAAKSLLIFGVF